VDEVYLNNRSPSGTSGLYYSSKDKKVFTLIDSRKRLVFRKEIDLSGTSFLGSTHDGKFFTYWFDRHTLGKGHRFTLVYLSRKNEAEFKTISDINLLPESEKYYHSYFLDNHFFLVSLDARHRQVIVRRYSDTIAENKHIFNLPEEYFNMVDQKDIRIFLPDVDYHFSELEGKDKMYVQSPDKIVFSFDYQKMEAADEKKRCTRILIFDLTKDTLLSRDFIIRDLDYYLRSSSYWFKDKLYRVVLDPEFVRLDIEDFNSGSVKTYNYHKGEQIGIVSDYIKVIQPPYTKELLFKTTKDLYEDLGNTRFVVSVTEFRDSMVAVRTGAFSLETLQLKNYSPLTHNPGFYTSLNNPVVESPIGPQRRTNYLNTYGRSDKYVSAIWFDSFVNQTDSRLQTGYIKLYDYEKVQKFRETFKDELDKDTEVVAFKADGAEFVAFISRKEKAFKIYQLE
jgi:hypothetical protein